MDTKSRILGCAFKELEKSGIEQFSLRSVGAAAGLSAMAVYRHFENKEDLLRALAEQAFAEWSERVQVIRESDLRAWFRKAMRAYVEFSLDEPGRFDLCFVLKTQVERIYPDDFRAGKSPAVSLVMQRIEAGQRAGYLKDDDSLEMAMFAWAELHGLVMLHRAGRFGMSRKDFIALCKRCSDRALDSFVARES
jgi:AcrR family transcriptional regulator